MYDEILYEVNDPVAVITLNRPEALNAWTNSMGDELSTTPIRRAAAQPFGVVGIVVTGAGRAFCAGADMNLLSRYRVAAAGDGWREVASQNLLRHRRRTPNPTGTSLGGSPR